MQEQKQAKKDAIREKKSEAMKLAHAARRADVNAAAAAAGTAATGVATIGGFQTLIVEDSTLPHPTVPPPAGDEIVSSQLPPQKLSLLLQVPVPNFLFRCLVGTCVLECFELLHHPATLSVAVGDTCLLISRRRGTPVGVELSS